MPLDLGKYNRILFKSLAVNIRLVFTGNLGGPGCPTISTPSRHGEIKGRAEVYFSASNVSSDAAGISIRA